MGLIDWLKLHVFTDDYPNPEHDRGCSNGCGRKDRCVDGYCSERCKTIDATKW